MTKTFKKWAYKIRVLTGKPKLYLDYPGQIHTYIEKRGNYLGA